MDIFCDNKLFSSQYNVTLFATRRMKHNIVLTLLSHQVDEVLTDLLTFLNATYKDDSITSLV